MTYESLDRRQRVVAWAVLIAIIVVLAPLAVIGWARELLGGD